MDTCIIIVTYNGMPWIEKCLQSCGDYPVVVVDNASSDETVTFIKNNFPKVVIMPQTINLGFGQGNNVGIKYALEQGAEHFFLLNQDAYFIDDCLKKLISFQKKNKSYGILSPIHINADRSKLDRNFSEYMTPGNNEDFYSDYVLKKELKAVYPVPFVNAAAWLLSKDLIDTVGGFDPLFFHYGEDDNFCQRTNFHNFKIGVIPESFIIHDREARESPKVISYSELYFTLKERTLKVKHGNINNAYGMNHLQGEITRLKKTNLKMKLKGKFSKLEPIKKELDLCIKIMPAIQQSRELNVLKGRSHL